MPAWPSTVTVGQNLGADFFNGLIDNGVHTDDDNSLGAHYLDIAGIASPANPAAGSRRLFVDTADGEFKIRRSDGTVISIEGAAGNSITRGAAGSRPASATLAGDVYIHTDEPYWSFWDGAAWVLLLRGNGPAITEPAAGTWANQSDANANTNFGGVRLDIPARASVGFSGQYSSLAAAPVTRTSIVRVHARNAGTAALLAGGAFMYEAATTKLMLLGLGVNSGGNVTLSVTKWATPTSTPTIAKQEPLLFTPEFAWLRVENDTTDVIFSISLDGNVWKEFFREAKATHFTTAPDNAGWGGFTQNSDGPVEVHVVHNA